MSGILHEIQCVLETRHRLYTYVSNKRSSAPTIKVFRIGRAVLYTVLPELRLPFDSTLATNTLNL